MSGRGKEACLPLSPDERGREKEGDGVIGRSGGQAMRMQIFIQAIKTPSDCRPLFSNKEPRLQTLHLLKARLTEETGKEILRREKKPKQTVT